ncbi:hypothetical protein C6P44_000758 [Monosporozyma unispora]|nr:hypothetical protein C6P44_000758 [Kazachstania unispora]
MYINTQRKNSNNNNNNNNNNITMNDTTNVAVSPTRIFPDNDFSFNHSSSISSVSPDEASDYFQISPSKPVPFNHNLMHKSSMDFIKAPKRVMEFNKRSQDDDLIKSNTEKNRYILQRSKSLPFNSLKLKSNLKQSSRPTKNHQRSKSVHFDEVLPVKFFSKYECPTVVSRQNSDCDIIEKINFDKIKPLRRFQYDTSDDEYSDDDDDDTEPEKVKEDGLYDVNFSILNNTSNNKDIKLNVFVNSEKDSTIILQNIKLEKRKTYNDLNDYFIWGKVNVKNIFFEKCIYIRYTLNDWKTYNEVKARYINDPTHMQNFDTFDFSLYSVKNLILNENEHVIKKDNIIEGDLQFCIHYETMNPATQEKLEFWNNNNNKNYFMHVVLHEKDTMMQGKDSATHKNDSQLFKTDKYYNIANELGGFNKKNNKFGKYKNSIALTDEQKDLHSTFLDDLLNTKDNNTELDDDEEGPFWFNNNNLLLTTNKYNDEELFFKDFRNPFAN